MPSGLQYLIAYLYANFHRHANYQMIALTIEMIHLSVRFVNISVRYYRYAEMNDTLILIAEILSKPKAPYNLCLS